MADKLPYFRWFPKDAETSESYASMTDAQLGFYHRCLNRSWLNDGLPADPTARANALQKPRAYADKMWAGLVAGRFHLDENGRYRNARQEEERAKAISKSKQASDARNSRNGRLTDVDTYVPSDADIRARARPGSGSGSGSEVETTSLEKTSTRAREPSTVSEPEFQQFIACFLSLGVALSEADMRKCAMDWVSLEDHERQCILADTRIKSAGEWAACAKKFVPRPWNYLANRQWERVAVVNGRDRPESPGEASTRIAMEQFRKEHPEIV